MHYLLFYRDLVDNYLEKRESYRAAHLAHARAAEARGELILAGALAEPADGAILLFSADSPAIAEQFAQQDPYVLNGLIGNWQVRQWSTVVGQQAAIKR